MSTKFTQSLDEAVEILKSGGVGVFPTETIYGLGALATSPSAQERIYQLKKRPSNKPFSLHVSSIEMVESLNVHFAPEFYILARAFLPGPLTLIVPIGEATLGIRFPNHPIALKLIDQVGSPLVATSVNLSNAPPAITLEEVKQYFPTGLDFILDALPYPQGVASTIVSLCDPHQPQLVREGIIPFSSVLQAL